MSRWSLTRTRGMIIKEFIQMGRDRMTFAIMFGIPVIQLVLFGFAINTDPKKLPTAVVVHEASAASRSILQAIDHTDYFHLLPGQVSHHQADHMLQAGQALFVIAFPPRFTEKMVRGEHPNILIEADATDPVAAGNALSAIAQFPHLTLPDMKISAAPSGATGPPFGITIHRRYNPEGISQYNIVPGLMGVILTMTMVLVTAVAITREHEKGTMEYLLVTPVQPLEVMAGKLIPYIFVGYVQVILILLAAVFLFHVPIRGSITLVLLLMLPFIAANLSMGITFSTLAKNQMQAMQMSFFFFLPSILLSGFMFPFRGMPEWAQWIGEVLPLTHFLRIVRGILLKESGFQDIVPELWPILAFFAAAITIAAIRYRRTLD